MHNQKLDSALNIFLSTLDAFHPSIATALRPGLNRDSIIEAFESINFDAPAELIQLYQWRDGTEWSHSPELDIVPGCYFLPLEHALTQHCTNELFKDIGEPLWDSFRILSDHGTGGYSLATNAAGGKVIERCVHDSWKLAFDSLSTLFELSAACYSSGVFRTEHKTSIEIDWDHF